MTSNASWYRAQETINRNRKEQEWLILFGQKYEQIQPMEGKVSKTIEIFELLVIHHQHKVDKLQGREHEVDREMRSYHIGCRNMASEAIKIIKDYGGNE